MVLWFKAKTANSGASTLNVNGLGAQPLVGGAHSALQGGEIVAGGKCQTVWRADISSWVLLECTGGALQVAAPTQSNHAVGAGDARYAALAGLASQLFAVAGPTATQHAVNLGQFAATLPANGYVKIPVLVGGSKLTLIIQWGTVAAIPAGGGATWSFPIAFPNGYLGGVAVFNNTGGISGSAAGGIGNATNANAVLFNNGSSGDSQISAIVVGWQMDWKFSAATDGFYPADSLDDCPNLPGDLVDVSAERKAELMLAEPAGKMIIAGADGNPVVVDRPSPTDAERAATARTIRDQLLSATDWTQLPDLPAPTKEKYVAYRQALRNLPGQAGFPGMVNFPELPA